MNPLRKFKEYITKGIVKKQMPDKFRANFLISNSELYIAQQDYTFDDNTEKVQLGSITINEQIAGQMLENFMDDKNNIESLLVHCTYGRNRSPAVAMAFNNIFNLGHNTDELMKQYNYYNRYVYAILKETARKLRIK